MTSSWPAQLCFIPTATGDSPAAIEAVTEVFVGREDVDFSVLTLFTQPSVPDFETHLTAQDVLLAGGGSLVMSASLPSTTSSAWCPCARRNR